MIATYKRQGTTKGSFKDKEREFEGQQKGD